MSTATTWSEKVEQLVVPGVNGISPYIPGKSIELIEREQGISQAVKLASNENPYGPCPAVLSRIKELVTDIDVLSRYPDGSAYKLRQKLQQFLGLASGDCLTFGNGSNDVLDIISRCFSGPSDEVIFSQYAFAVYAISTQAVGAKAVITPAVNWGNDLQAMLTAITAKTKIIFIANPNNPTGTYLPKNTLLKFLNRVPENVIVVIDEAYSEYACHPLAPCHHDFSSAINWIKDYSNLIVTRTFSKAYGLASFRIGYAVSDPVVANVLNRVRQPFNNNTLALELALTALDNQPYIQLIAEKNCLAMRKLEQVLDEMAIEYITSAANFICINVGENAVDIEKKFIQHGVIVRAVANYNMPNFLRISLGKDFENQKLIRCCKEIL